MTVSELAKAHSLCVKKKKKKDIVKNGIRSWFTLCRTSKFMKQTVRSEK